MRITVPAQDADGNRLPDVVKTVEAGGGVKVRLEGTRYQTEGTVVKILDDDHVLVRGIGFEAEVNTAAVIDCMPRDERIYQEAVDKNINGKGEAPVVDAAWTQVADDEWKDRLGLQ